MTPKIFRFHTFRFGQYGTIIACKTQVVNTRAVSATASAIHNLNSFAIGLREKGLKPQMADAIQKTYNQCILVRIIS